MPSLIISSGGKTARFGMNADVVTMGRGTENTIRLQDIRSSRRHCQIVKTDKGFVLQDLGSGNGTTLNGDPVSESILKDGDKIQIGSTVITFSGASNAPSAPPTPEQLADAPVSPTERTVKMSPSEVKVATAPTMRTKKAAKGKARPAASGKTRAAATGKTKATPSAKVVKASPSGKTRKAASKPAASGKTRAAVSGKAKPAASGRTRAAATAGSKGASARSGKTARSGSTAAASRSGRTSRSGATSARTSRGRSGSMSAQISARQAAAKRGKNMVVVFGGIGVVVVLIVLMMLFGGSKGPGGQATSEAQAKFEEAQDLVRKYNELWSKDSNPPEKRIEGLNSLYQAVPIFKQIGEDFKFDEVYGKNAKLAYANYKDWYAKETEAREKVPAFIEKFQGRKLKDSPQLLEECKEIQNKYGASNTFYKNLADIREKLEREAPMATGQDMIKYDTVNTNSQKFVKDNKFSDAVKSWNEYIGSVSDAIYLTKAKQKLRAVQEDAKKYFVLISKRAAGAADSKKAREMLLKLEPFLAGTDAEDDLTSELAKYPE